MSQDVSSLAFNLCCCPSESVPAVFDFRQLFRSFRHFVPSSSSSIVPESDSIRSGRSGRLLCVSQCSAALGGPEMDRGERHPPRRHSPEEHRIVSDSAAMTTMENSIWPPRLCPGIAASVLPPSAVRILFRVRGSIQTAAFMTPCLRAGEGLAS